MNFEQYRATYIAHCGMSNGKQPLLSEDEFHEAWERYEELFSKIIDGGMDPSGGLVKEYAELLYLLFVTEWERYCQINGLLEGGLIWTGQKTLGCGEPSCCQTHWKSLKSST